MRHLGLAQSVTHAEAAPCRAGRVEIRVGPGVTGIEDEEGRPWSGLEYVTPQETHPQAPVRIGPQRLRVQVSSGQVGIVVVQPGRHDRVPGEVPEQYVRSEEHTSELQSL